jgi:hypothetical protein
MRDFTATPFIDSTFPTAAISSGMFCEIARTARTGTSSPPSVSVLATTREQDVVVRNIPTSKKVIPALDFRLTSTSTAESTGQEVTYIDMQESTRKMQGAG